MNFKYFTKKLSLILLTVLFLSSLTQCGLYRKTDARKIPVNSKERVAKNVEEGRRIKFSELGNSTSGKFEFATSNEMWRATIDILDFLPLSDVDYGGGIIITEWYSAPNSTNESLKIMVQFLTNEIRADGLKVKIYKKDCKTATQCSSSLIESEIGSQIKLEILKKATLIKQANLENK